MSHHIYHMCPSSAFQQALQSHLAYFPPTYPHPQDGFIHATSEPALLIDVANHFYRESPGEWICLEIDPALLTGGPQSVRYEAPAPVGDKESYHKENEESTRKFPHIYGGINAESVVRTYPISRAEDGTFIAINGIQ